MASSQQSESRILVCENVPSSFPFADVKQVCRAPMLRVVGGIEELSNALDSNKIALVMVGVSVSNFDIPTLCRVLRKSPQTASIPVCVVAPANSRVTRLEMLRAGAAEFLGYPWDAQEVVLRLDRLITSAEEMACPHAATTRQDLPLRLSREEELVWAAKEYLLHCREYVPQQHELARLMGTTKSRLNAAFFAVLGFSGTEYLRRWCLHSAATLLRDGQLRVVDIAEICGYSNGANFATAFRKFSGVSPIVYREQGRLDNCNATFAEASDGN